MTADEVAAKLEELQGDPMMVTKSMYSPTANDYPNNQLPFVQIHLAYLAKNKQVNPAQYISNLEIMIKKRS